MVVSDYANRGSLEPLFIIEGMIILWEVLIILYPDIRGYYEKNKRY